MPPYSGDGFPEDLKHAFGRPNARGRIKAVPEDFVVSEQLGFEPEGKGQHLLLRVRKRSANTEWVARRLARVVGIPVREVGFAGLKDRHSVSEQWFSLTMPLDAGIPDFAPCAEEFEVIAVTRHTRKLKRGGLKANRFEIRVTQLQGDEEELRERLRAISRAGVPNYFGPQRFGVDANNLRLAHLLLVEGERIKDRSRRAFAYSAARSFLFNLVLSRRVKEESWERFIPGDVANLDGTRSTFTVAEPDSTLRARLERMDIHPTGPLWGAGLSQAEDQALSLEQSECGGHPLARGLEGTKLRSARRSLRLPVREFQWSVEPGVLKLSFCLAAGGYATSVLREILQAEANTHS